MKDKLIQILSSPITQSNFIIIGLLIMIQSLHIHAHNSIEADIDGYVKEYCKKNAEQCIRFGNNNK